ncbi:unnamed protein product, partial [Mesorhabditis belari]|uniref:G-protein coupled receptors family 1 profile domain-containing protein n=1 Tax=Mesorhabditis belari TaxID=2138241 RepID=A0AAF3ETD5_9BILA
MTTPLHTNLANINTTDVTWEEMEKWIVQMCETMFPIQATLGIVGNFINLLVLFSTHMRSRVNTLLAFAAISDMIFLAAMIPHNMARRTGWMFRDCMPNETNHFNQTSIKCYTDFALFYFANKSRFTSAANCFSSFSSWLIVVVTFDRLWAIKSPFSARKHRCSFREILVIPALFMISFLTTIQYALNKTRIENNRFVQEMFLTEELQKLLVFVHILHATFLPILTLLILNMFLLYYLRNRRQYFETISINRDSSRRTTRSDSDLQDGSPPLIEPEPTTGHQLVIPTMSQGGSYQSPSHQATNNTFQNVVAQLRVNSSSLWNRQLSKAERHVTITVVAIVSCYIITHIPSAIIFGKMYLMVSEGKTMYAQKSSYTWAAVSNFFVITGKVTNFFLFCLSSKHFRFHLKQLFWGRRSWSSKKHSRPRIELHSACVSNTDNGPYSSVGLRLVAPTPSTVASAVEISESSAGVPRTRSLPLSQLPDALPESAIAPV